MLVGVVPGEGVGREDKYAELDETRGSELRVAGHDHREDGFPPRLSEKGVLPSLIIRLTIIFNDFAIS